MKARQRILGGGGLTAKACLTLCDPMHCSLPGSSVPGISQAKILEWSCHFLLASGLLHCRWVLYRLSHQGERMLTRN